MNARATLNETVAGTLEEIAGLLEAQDENPFRVSAYRKAAASLRRLERDVGAIARSGGREALTEIPAVGEGIAGTIHELVTTGRSHTLERLRRELEPVQVFQTVPGLGPELAERIHETLGIGTLEALEQAAHDGRLEAVEGMGRRRTAAVRAVLASMLGRRQRPQPPREAPQPEVGLLLDVDRAYREQAEAGALPRIAPKRFNPEGEAWLPVMHTERGPWHFTALFSNTARAHELERTHDWVVIYFHRDDGGAEDQHTVVTEHQGELRGRRVVRGREDACRAYYRQAAG